MICSTPSRVTKSLNATDALLVRFFNWVGGGFEICQHQYADWSEPVESRDHIYGAWKIIKRDAVLLSTSKNRSCSKCGQKQTHKVSGYSTTINVGSEPIKAPAKQDRTIFGKRLPDCLQF
jgi:hypothetical protein